MALSDAFCANVTPSFSLGVLNGARSCPKKHDVVGKRILQRAQMGYTYISSGTYFLHLYLAWRLCRRPRTWRRTRYSSSHCRAAPPPGWWRAHPPTSDHSGNSGSSARDSAGPRRTAPGRRTGGHNNNIIKLSELLSVWQICFHVLQFQTREKDKLTPTKVSGWMGVGETGICTVCLEAVTSIWLHCVQSGLQKKRVSQGWGIDCLKCTELRQCWLYCSPHWPWGSW